MVNGATCPTHGPYKFLVVDHPFDSGTITISDLCPACSKEYNEKKDAEDKAARIAERVQRSGLPILRPGYGFDSFPLDKLSERERERAKRAVLALGRWCGRIHAWRAAALAGNDAQGLWTCLVGSVGTGKSGLAYAVALDGCRRDMGVRYFTATDLVRYVWDANKRGSYAEEAVAQIGGCELLIVDEIGLKPLGEQESAQLSEIFDLRYRHRAATLLVSNGTEAQLRETLKERVSSRLDELGYFLACDWTSLRGRK